MPSPNAEGGVLQAGDSGNSCSSSVKGLLASQEEPVLQKKSEGSLLAEFPLARTGSAFCAIQAFNCLDKDHPYDGRQSALLKVH